MRRKDKAVENLEDQRAIIRKSRVCRLAMCDDGQPYVVPLCFGYQDNYIYFHSAVKGRKIDILKRNNQVCVEFDLDGQLEVNEKACKWGMHYHSVIAFGTAEFLETDAEKKKGLDLIMAHYDGPLGDYSKEALAAVAVIKITIQKMTSKKG